MDQIAARLAPEDPAVAQGRAFSLFTMIIGTLQLSRALADRELSDELLEHGLGFLGEDHYSCPAHAYRNAPTQQEIR